MEKEIVSRETLSAFLEYEIAARMCYKLVEFFRANTVGFESLEQSLLKAAIDIQDLFEKQCNIVSPYYD